MPLLCSATGCSLPSHTVHRCAHAPCRQEAQLAREQLQARVTILEGRVRFLEAGYELQPPQLLQCAAHQGQPPAQPLALTWGPGGSSPARGGVPAAHSPPVAAWGGQAGGQVAAAGGTAAWLQQTTPLQLQDSQPHAHSNPLFDSQPSFAASRQQPAAMAAGAAAAPAPAASWGAAAGTAAAITAHQLQPVAAATVAPPPAAVVPAPAPAQRGYSSAAELISSMQARFSEADDFLLSLRRL